MKRRFDVLGRLAGLANRMESRLFLVYLFLILLPIGAITYVSAYHNSRTLENNTITYASQISDKMMNNLDDYIRDMKKISIIPAYLGEIQDGLKMSNAFYESGSKDGPGGTGPGSGPGLSESQLRLQIQRKVESSIYFMNNLKEGTSSVYVFDKLGNAYTAIRSGGARADLADSYKRWEPAAAAANGTPVLVGTEAFRTGSSPGTRYAFTVVRDIIDSSYKSVGLIAVDADIAVLENMVAALDRATQGTTLIADESGHVVYDSERRLLGSELADTALFARAAGASGSFHYDSGGEEQLVIYRRSDETGWRMLIAIPERHLMADAARNRNYTFVAAGVTIAAALAISLVLIVALTRPLRSLVGLMKRVRQGSFDVSFPVKRRDEIGLAGHAFNRMIAHIRQLIDNIYRIEQRKSEMELDNLQRQINPHFIYNTLESIRMTAILNDDPDVGHMAQLLGQQLRYSLEPGELVPVSAEWDHLRHYIRLVNYRYGDRFRLDITPEAQAAPVRVRKLLFQPIVENAVLHGYDDGQRLTIVIDSTLERDARLFTIRDDGRGMDAAELERLRAALRQSEPPGGFGVADAAEADGPGGTDEPGAGGHRRPPARTDRTDRMGRTDRDDDSAASSVRGQRGIRNREGEAPAAADAGDRRMTRRRGGIGLRNVNDRLKLSYGPAWGLEIDSAPGKGTVVTVRIPPE